MKQTLIFVLLAALVGGCGVGGESRAHHKRVKNQQLILIREGSTVAAIAFTKQAYGKPDVAEFEWLCRSDGSLMLDLSQSSVLSGHSTTTQSRVSVDNIQFEWSYSSPTRGYIYYDCLPSQTPPSNALSICVTDLEFADLPVDADDPRFVWRQKPE